MVDSRVRCGDFSREKATDQVDMEPFSLFPARLGPARGAGRVDLAAPLRGDWNPGIFFTMALQTVTTFDYLAGGL